MITERLLYGPDYALCQNHLRLLPNDSLGDSENVVRAKFIAPALEADPHGENRFAFQEQHNDSPSPINSSKSIITLRPSRLLGTESPHATGVMNAALQPAFSGR